MSSSETKAKLKKPAAYLLCVITGALLSMAYPGWSQADVAWVALVPLLILLRFSTPRDGFRLGFTFGLAFWLCSITWLMELRNNGGPVLLVAFGLVGLSVCCAAFIGFFGMAVSSLWRGGDSATGGWRREWFETWRPVVAALLWCGAEYLRSTLFTGFAWNALGVTQSKLLPAMQAASLGGVYAVSFLIVLLNGGVAGAAVRIWRNIIQRPERSRRQFDLMIALSVLMIALAWGTHRVKAMRAEDASAKTVAIAAVNPSLPCIFESNDDEWDDAHRFLTENTKALGIMKPDLIVWPETVLYASMPDSSLEANLLGFTRHAGVPVLAGGTEWRTDDAGVERIYNSSFLFSVSNGVSAVYRKQHLVPFGEFIPFDKTLTFLQKLAPAGISCSPGKESVVMEIADGSVRVSPLICFEDTVAGLSRAAVKAGASILIAQSNDAWFFGSSEAEQHHAQAVFRAVENGVPMVRCSNRGISAVVTAYGASSDNAAYFIQHVPVPASRGITLYAKVGDWIFGIPCAALLCGFMFFIGRKRFRHGSKD